MQQAVEEHMKTEGLKKVCLTVSGVDWIKAMEIQRVLLVQSCQLSSHNEIDPLRWLMHLQMLVERQPWANHEPRNDQEKPQMEDMMDEEFR